MSTIRFFNGGRGTGGRSIAGEIMRIEVQKKGKMPSADRFKYIFKKRLEENKKKALGGKTVGFSFPTSFKEARQMSKKAEIALKQMAQKKATKEAKALRQMVIVQPRVFPNGRIVRDGKIFDVAGNIVAKVNTKNGKMATMMGWSLGKYKPRSASTNAVIYDAIDKYSPYYINLRKMQALQQGQQNGATGDVINVYGHSSPRLHTDNYGYASDGSSMLSGYGSDAGGPRQNVGATSWGAMSDNTWGTFADNVWGTSTDTAWGTNTSDVWGGIGGSPFGSFAKTVHIWGTGNGHNYLKGLTSRVAAFFGLNLKSKASRAAFHEAVSGVRNSRTAVHEQSTRAVDHHSSASATTRSSAPAPTTRR